MIPCNSTLYYANPIPSIKCLLHLSPPKPLLAFYAGAKPTFKQLEGTRLGNLGCHGDAHFVTGFAGIWHKREKNQKMSTIFKKIQKRPNASKCFRAHPNVSQRIQEGPNRSKHVSEPAQTSKNLRKTLRKLSKTSRKLREGRVRAVVVFFLGEGRTARYDMA